MFKDGISRPSGFAVTAVVETMGKEERWGYRWHVGPRRRSDRTIIRAIMTSDASVILDYDLTYIASFADTHTELEILSTSCSDWGVHSAV